MKPKIGGDRKKWSPWMDYEAQIHEVHNFCLLKEQRRIELWKQRRKPWASDQNGS
ncbi:hypothetical protein [Cytobacillus firmus]|uniref:hypothetical protein n=1 Tax=Cytobacillus firmus TaxID=1399 RepID=UPI001C8D8B76|nr:hypothetical protein [Cytobacillus firmus]MBX9974688.1 hypothetical protein [Cytobacillus firmus]